MKYSLSGIIASSVWNPVISGNSFQGTGRGTTTQGIVFGEYRHPLRTGTVSGNAVRGFHEGIIASESTCIDIHDNDSTGNVGTDCVDLSGDQNTWTNNVGDESLPAGICTPAP